MCSTTKTGVTCLDTISDICQHTFTRVQSVFKRKETYFLVGGGDWGTGNAKVIYLMIYNDLRKGK